MQNESNPDVNSVTTNDDASIEQENGGDNGRENEEMPVPPDTRPNAPVEEPPDTEKPPIEEDNTEPKRIV